MEASFPGS